MPRNAVKKCEAPWGCDYVTAKDSGEDARNMYGHELCRPCYQYAWERLRGLSASKRKVQFDLLPPVCRMPEDKDTHCRCGTFLPKGSTNKKRRFIGRASGGQPIAVCRPCYQRAYEFKRDNLSITEMEDAWHSMPHRVSRKATAPS